jgi:hypothetical protein
MTKKKNQQTYTDAYENKWAIYGVYFAPTMTTSDITTQNLVQLTTSTSVLTSLISIFMKGNKTLTKEGK